jgi:NAD(P)H-dependent FMN reductase
MSKLKIAVVISTTPAARFGHKPAQWIRDIAAERDDMEIEIVDLRDFPMPFFDEVASNAWMPSQNEVAQRWQKKSAGSTATSSLLQSTIMACRQR